MMLCGCVFLLALCATVLANKDVDDVLAALNKRLASSTAKVEALRASTERVLHERNADAKRHASILGRKRSARDATVCPDGTAVDTDRDGHLDCFDQCPTDFRKTRPGACGCGELDTDSDGDGAADCLDACPLDAAKRTPGLCGCGSQDTGCGCNVSPVRAADCSHVLATPAHGLDVSTFDVFAPHGGVGARVVLPHDALKLNDGEQLVLKLTEAQIDPHSDNQLHSLALDIDLVSANGVAPRDRATNGYLLERAAKVCLQPESALQADGLCLGFYDAKTDGFKCFEEQVAVEGDESRLACARVSLLTRVQLVRRTRQTSLQPYVKSVAPAHCPADGSCAFTISGGNFDRGVLTRVAIGGAELDVEQCRYNSRTIECDAAPAGRGIDLPVQVTFTNHVADDMRFDAQLERAFSYDEARIHEVELVGERVVVRGSNFGPEGALHASAVTVNGEPCVEARVDAHDNTLSCVAPARVLAKRHIEFNDDDDVDYMAPDGSVVHYSSDDDDDDDHHHHHEVAVALDMHQSGNFVQSTKAQWKPACNKPGYSMCGDRSCVSRREFCAHCPSGWAQCPLSAPLMAGGHCHTMRWQQDNKAPKFDITLDGMATRVPIGRAGALNVPFGAGSTLHKHCLSVSMPDHDTAGFASRVFNVSSHMEWNSCVSIEMRSDEIRANGGDPYGYCLARYNQHSSPKRWECVDESLEAGPAPKYFVAGDVILQKGDNWLAIIKDNCPHLTNPSQEDEDGNGIGDACDAPAEVAESCRDRSAGNVKYIQKILSKTSFDVEEQDCPYGDADGSRPVCNVNGKIFNKHIDNWKGPARPLPLKAPYPASEKGARKSFPVRQGIDAYPVSDRQTRVRGVVNP